MNNNPWTQATKQALAIKRSALDEVAGQVAGRVSDQDQAARYLHFRQNPQDLIAWSAKYNGAERALPEATRYLSEMRRRYGDS